MSDAPHAPGAGGKRPPGANPLPAGSSGTLRPPSGSPLGYAGPVGPRPVPSVSSAAAEPTPSFVPKLRPPPDPADLVPESEGWEDDTIATGPEPGLDGMATVAATPAPPVATPSPLAATPLPPRAATASATGASQGAGSPRGSLGQRRVEPTPPPGEVRLVDPARPSPVRPASPSAPLHGQAADGVSDAVLQKILDDVRFATRKEIPRLVDAELAPVLRAQQEILTRLDRLEAMIRVSQATADDALQRANHAGAAASGALAQPIAAPMHAPPPVAHVAVAHAAVAHAPTTTQVIQLPPATPVLTAPSVPPPAYHGDPLGSMAPLRPMPVDVVPYSGGDFDIPNELTHGRGRGVKLMLLVAVLVLGGFAAMVISSNMH